MQQFSKEEMMSDEEFEAFRKRVFGEDSGRIDGLNEASLHGFTLFYVGLDESGTLCVRSKKRTPDGATSCGGYSLRPGDRGYEASVQSFDYLGIEKGKYYVKQERWDNGEWVVEREGLNDDDEDCD